MDHVYFSGDEYARGLLNDVIPDSKNKIRLGDRLMQVVTGRECGGPEALRQPLVYHSLAHLRSEKWDIIPLDELREVFSDTFAIGSGPHQDHGAMSTLESNDNLGEHLVVYAGTPDFLRREDNGLGSFVPGNVFRELDMYSSRTLVLGYAKSISQQCGDSRSVRYRRTGLGNGSHHIHHIDDLEVALFGTADRFLSRNNENGCPSERSMCNSRDHVGSTRTERGKRNSWPASESAVSSSHKNGRLLVARKHETDIRTLKRIEQIEIFLSRYAEDIFHSLSFKACNEQIRGFHEKTIGNVLHIRMQVLTDD